jgi:ATP-dependent Lhr-like helicase
MELIIEKFGSLTEIQKKAIPIIASGKNTLIIAPTGSGKTEAAVVPILKKVSEENLKGIAVVYITPLRALNRDLLKRLFEWCKKLGITISVRHGDTTIKERTSQAKIPPQFLITTPETLQAIIPAKKMREHLKNLKYLIVDEVHELIGNKRGVQLSVGIERLSEIANFQIVGISATISEEDKVAKFLFGQRDYKIVKVEKNREMKIKIFYLEENEGDEYHDRVAKKINELITEKSIVFTNTRAMAEILGSRLMKISKENGKRVAVHHGSLSKDVRIKVENDFKSGNLDAIVATSSLELGIDIGDVSQVIQFSSPRQVIKLVQRIGRSEHKFDRPAKGYIVCTNLDDYLESTVISEMAESGNLEEQKIYENALDVLSHQIAGILLDYDKKRMDEVYSILKRSTAYFYLNPEDFMSVVNFMSDKNLLRKRDEYLERTGKTRIYYYENLSTIPSVERYLVRDSASNTIISSLDDEFVMFLENGDKFITKGMPWRVLDINSLKKEVIVEPCEDFLAAIPDWEGEEIPTSFEVSQGVGRIKSKIKELNLDKKEKIISSFSDLKDNEVPTDRRILIEYHQDVMIVHIHGGLKLNRTLSLYLARKLSDEFGTVKSTVDPYRIIFVFSTFSEKAIGRFSEILRNFNEEEFKEILSESKIFQYKFLHVAKFFGIKFKKMSKKIVSLFNDTPIFNETMRETLFSYYDLEKAKKILDEIAHKKIEIVIRNGISKIGKDALTKYNEYVIFVEPSQEILKRFKAEILSKQVILLCTNCLNDFIGFVGELGDLKCKKCGSKLLASCDEDEIKVYKKFKKGKEKMTNEERKIVEKIVEKIERKAGIIASSGKKGLIALSAYGVGPEKASKILSMKLEEDEFYKELLNAQKEFIRTRGYWREY